MGTIIIVDDNKGVLTAVQLLLKNHFSKVITLSSPVSLSTVLREENPEVVLLDMNFTSGINNGNEGLFWLHEIKRQYRDLPVVLFTAYADIDLAVRGIKEGASDFVVKPWDNQKLLETLLNAASQAKDGKKKNRKKESSPVSAMYWGESSAMQQLRTLIEKVATTNANILITGENGTGKEMLAREIHALSPRSAESMISVDMGAITESLFESELFGHVKGSFTDAHADRTGKFEAADRSSLFLDEIGNLPFHLQAKLLTAIQQRSIVRVGSNQSIPVDIRLICATNRNLQEMVDKGLFREDLLYRINTIHLELPPLRERGDDILLFIDCFLRKFTSKYQRQEIRIHEQTVEKLRSYHWPGNIRELQHTIEKAVILCEGSVIRPKDILVKQTWQPQATATVPNLEEVERRAIETAILQNNGNLTAAAEQLGVSRQTLYNKLKRFKL